MCCHFNKVFLLSKCNDAGSFSKCLLSLSCNWASLVAQTVKNLPTVQETWVQSLGWEDPLEKEMTPIPVLLTGEFHGQRSLVGHNSQGCKELDVTE